MSLATSECLHGLDPATCSICLAPTRHNARSVESLYDLVREALEAYPHEDLDLVLRIVYSEAVALPNAVDLFLPLLRTIPSNIDGQNRRQLQQGIGLPWVPSASAPPRDRTAPAAGSQDEPNTFTNTSTAITARPGSSVPEAIDRTPPSPGPPPAPLPGRDQRSDDSHATHVPPGSTLAQFSHDRREELERGTDVWMASFARKYAPAPLNLRSGWHGTIGSASLMQIREKITELRGQASGIADFLQMLGRVEKILVVHRARNINEFNAAQTQLPAPESIGPSPAATPPNEAATPEREEP